MFKLNIGKLSALSGITDRDLVGVNLSGNILKVAHIKFSPNKKEVVDLLSRDITGMTDIDISKAIQDSVSGFKANRVDIIDIIPSHLIITKNIEIPSTQENEIKEIVRLQAGRHTPYSREEIIIDYIEIGTYRHSYTKILLVIVAKNLVKRHNEIFEKAGFKLDKVLLVSECLAYSITKALRLEAENIPTNIVYVDDSFTDFSVILKNRVIFIRSIPIGMTQLKSEKEIYEKRFVDEIKKSLEAYLGEDIEKIPNMLVLTGAEDKLRGIEILLNNTLHLPVKLWTYFENVNISEKAYKQASMAKSVSFLDVVASVLNCAEMKINLIPEEVKVRKSIEERGRDLIKTGVFILTIFILAFFILICRIIFEGEYLKNLNSRYAILDKEADKLEKYFVRIGAVKNYITKRGSSLDVLAELHSITPLDIELSEVRYDDQGKISVKGTAGAMSSVFSFVDNMDKSKYFEAAKSKYTTKRKEGAKDLTDFEIAASIKRQED